MARGDQSLRQWKILITIVSHARYGVTRKHLLEEIEPLVPRGKGLRTLQRDLLVLEQAGFPIDRSQRPDTGEVVYKLLPEFQRIPPIAPSADELIALAVARSLLSIFKGTPLERNLDSFWQKAQAIFPADARNELEEAQSMFELLDRPAMEFTRYAPLIDQLYDAIRNRRQLTMLYFSQRKGCSSEYTIDPIKLFGYSGFLLLAGYVHAYKEVRHFSLDKIEKVTTTGVVFPRRTYSLERLKREAFGMIGEEPFELVVRFDREIADYVQRRIHHPTQRFETLPSGDVVITIRAGGWDDMKSWVLSYGHRAEVLKPEALRTEIGVDLKKMHSTYGG